ncbi:MAG: hypothetical protein Q7T88_00600 [Methylotenera sp.]|nr:hypothetical protein [Methylotenera sp.]
MFEIVNVFIVIFLLLIVARRRDATTLLLVLFTYGALHFSFAAISLTSKESAHILILQHIEGGGMFAELSALLLLGVVFFLLGRLAYNAFLLSNRIEKKIILQIIFVMGTVLFGYILNYRPADWMQLKNVISFELMLVLLMFGYLSVTGAHVSDEPKIYSWALVGLAILAFTDLIAIYEVFCHQSWAGTLESSGAMVYRASATLFNPNLLAFWASLVYLGCAYCEYVYKEHQKMLLWGMILASIAIYMSGSRSASYLLFLVLFIPITLMRNRLNLLALIVFPLTMLTIYSGARWFVTPFTSSSAGWHEIVLLGERFRAAPLYLINYILKLLGYPEVGFSVIGVPAEVVVSIEGRFLGGGTDSGWLVLYQDVGLIGFTAVILACCMLVVWGVRAYIADRSPSSVYALSTLFYCLLTGLVMRFQIFPVWLFIGIVFIPCFVFWQRAAFVVRD